MIISMKAKVNHDGKEQVLQTKRVGLFKPMEIWLDDELLGRWPKMSELNKGKIYKTASGSTLEIKMNSFPSELVMTFNGSQIEGSGGHPQTQVGIAYGVFAFVCFLNLAIGGIAYFGQIPSLLMVGFGIYNLIAGAIFFILLAIGYREKKLWPLCAGLILFLIDAGFMINTMLSLRMNNPGAIVMRIFLIIPWTRGCISAFKLNMKKAS